MTILHKKLRIGLALGVVLFASQAANATSATETCRMEGKLSLALSHAQRQEREPGEFANVDLVADSFERTEISGEVVVYAFLLTVGPSEHDLIRLYRVVREKAPCKPRASQDPVFLLHGATVDFRTSFLPSLLSAHVPREQSFAIFLAQRGLDVWGLDMRSTLIPAETTDFAFMRDWNYETNIQDTAVSLGMARHLRRLTGHGFEQMHLVGWSNGGMLTYAYANDETRFPRGHRHVKGLVPVDIAFKFSPNDEQLRLDACTRAGVIRSLFLDVGIFPTDERETRIIGFLAETAPNAPSPFAPQFTNRTVGLFGGTLTWQVLFSPAFPPFVPFYHLHAGQFDSVSALPIGLTFTHASSLFALYQEFPSWWVWREAFELNALQCHALDLPYDDHLAEVKVPVLYVGARGGFGRYGNYSTTLLGSRDVTTLNVTLLPDQPLDFAHGDLFWADNARTVAWAPILTWLRSH